MKLNGSLLVAVTMMIGSLGALGCNVANPLSAELAAPAPDQASPAAEPVKAAAKTDESATVVAKASLGAQPTAPLSYAPPPERYEYSGMAPSRDHSWIKGRWQRTSTRYVWVSGRWSNLFARKAPPPARYENPGRAPSGRHFFVPGHWRTTNRDHVWVPGHWETKTVGKKWIQARHDNVNGTWHYRPGHWVKR